MTDYWPQEENAVFDAESYILPCYPEGSISEMSSVKANASTTAGRLDVAASTAYGDGLGIALKAATGAGAPSRIPVLFYGAAKLTFDQSAAVTMGQFVMNSITTTYAVPTVSEAGTLKLFGGSSYVMGMALQTTAAGSDECIVLVGKCI